MIYSTIHFCTWASEQVSLQKHKFRNALWTKSYCLVVGFNLENDSTESKSIEINHKMKILTVAVMLLFTSLDTLPKQYQSISAKPLSKTTLENNLHFELDLYPQGHDSCMGQLILFYLNPITRCKIFRSATLHHL